MDNSDGQTRAEWALSLSLSPRKKRQNRVAVPFCRHLMAYTKSSAICYTYDIESGKIIKSILHVYSTYCTSMYARKKEQR